MHIITLTDHDKATWNDFTIRRSKGSVIDYMARHMIEQGISPNDKISVMRNGTKCFNDRSVKAWAKNTVRDNDKTGLSVVEFVPFDPTTIKGWK